MEKVEFERGDMVTYKNKDVTYNATVKNISEHPLTNKIQYRLRLNTGENSHVYVVTNGDHIIESELFEES